MTGLGVALQKYLMFAAFCVPFLAAAQNPSPNDPAVLWSQATLYRDEWGVPHVQADNLRAMAFAFGYAQADDHLETMLLAYRAANGRLAEIYGERYAEADELAIMMGHADLAREAYANCDFATRDLVEGFALGVNHWLVQNAAHAPAWAEGVQPSDILAFMHYYLMSQAPFDFDRRARRPKGTPSANAWAVAPSQSADGEAMLVINPHTAYDDLFQWYEAHLSIPGVNIAGATLYGLPVILQGHNEHLGWALTPNEADNADVYVESMPSIQRAPNSLGDIRQAAENAYALKTIADSKPYYVYTNDGMREMRAPQQMTPRGPVIAFWAGRPVSIRVGGYGEFGALHQLMAMANAKTLAEFQAALTLHQLPCFHVVYADKEGNLFYLYNTKVGQKQSFPEPAPNPLAGPVKSPWEGPVSAIDTSFQWGDVIAPARLPFVANPPSGYVQACATPPWRAAGEPADWDIESLRWLVHDVDSYRAKRVRQLLSQGERTFEDMQAMIFDPLAPFAVDAVPYLLHLAEDMPEVLDDGDPDLPAALDALREWNHLADETSTAMTLFHVWWMTFKENSPIPIETDADAYAVLQQPIPMLKEYALRALSEAVKRVRNEFQTINVPWGEVNTLWRGQRNLPAAGAAAGEPIFVSGQGGFSGGAWPVTYGYGYAMCVKFGSMPEAVSVVPFGASDRPDSPHYRDQLDLFADRQMKKTYFAREAVERAAERAWGSRMTFRPGEGAVVNVRAQYPVAARVAASTVVDGTVPASYAEFSHIVTPEIQPAEVLAEILVEFTIPEALCARNNLSELRIYGYDMLNGWAPIAEQRLDWDTRTFVGRLYGTQRVAVLGPERLRRAPVMLASAGSVPSPPSMTPNPIMPSPIVPVPRGYTPIRERVDENAAANEETAAESAEVTPVTPAEQPPPSLDMLAERTPEAGQVKERPRQIFEVTSPPVQPAPELESADEPEPPTQVAAATPSLPAPEPPAAEPSPEPTQTAAAEKPKKQGGVQWSSAPLSELVDQRYKPRHTLFLVPENALASPMTIGKSFDLRPPVPGALFHVVTEKTVRAQVQVLDASPAPLPDGLAAFTPIFAIEYDSRAVPGTAAVSLEVQPGVCAPGKAGELHLYAHDFDDGWGRVENQNRDTAAQSFSALDFPIRTYAVLGPAEHLMRPPR